MISHGSPLENLKVLEAWVLEFYKQYPTTCKFRHMSKLSMFMRKQGGQNWEARPLKLEALALWFCPCGKSTTTAVSPCRRTSWSYWSWTRRWMQCLRSTRVNFLSQTDHAAQEFTGVISTWATCSYFWKTIAKMKKKFPIFSLPHANCMALHILLYWENMLHLG